MDVGSEIAQAATPREGSADSDGSAAAVAMGSDVRPDDETDGDTGGTMVFPQAARTRSANDAASHVFTA